MAKISKGKDLARKRPSVEKTQREKTDWEKTSWGILGKKPAGKTPSTLYSNVKNACTEISL